MGAPHVEPEFHATSRSERRAAHRRRVRCRYARMAPSTCSRSGSCSERSEPNLRFDIMLLMIVRADPNKLVSLALSELQNALVDCAWTLPIPLYYPSALLRARFDNL